MRDVGGTADATRHLHGHLEGIQPEERCERQWKHALVRPGIRPNKSPYGSSRRRDEYICYQVRSIDDLAGWERYGRLNLDSSVGKRVDRHLPEDHSMRANADYGTRSRIGSLSPFSRDSLSTFTCSDPKATTWAPPATDIATQAPRGISFKSVTKSSAGIVDAIISFSYLDYDGVRPDTRKTLIRHLGYQQLQCRV